MGWEQIEGHYDMQWIVDDAIAKTPTGGAWVEIGVALGKGVAYMAHALARAGRDDVRIYAVDSWEGNARIPEQYRRREPGAHADWVTFLEAMKEHAPSALERLHVIRAPSVRAARLFEDASVHLVIVDGDHSYEGARADLEAWVPKVARGGVIGGDDHHGAKWPGVVRACREVFREGYEVREDGYPTWRSVR